MSSRDQDLLDKLFDVEKKAEALVADAQDDANRRIAAAKEKAEGDCSKAYDAAIKEANSRKSVATDSIRAEYERSIAGFKSGLEATAVDQRAFLAACETALAKKK